MHSSSSKSNRNFSWSYNHQQGLGHYSKNIENDVERNKKNYGKEITFRMPFSGSDAMSGMLDPAIRWNRFNIKLLDFRRMLYASQQ